MALVTYDNQSPADIRIGDVIRDKTYGQYTADSNAEKDQWNQIVVRRGTQWATYSTNDRVSITFDEVESYA